MSGYVLVPFLAAVFFVAFVGVTIYGVRDNWDTFWPWVVVPLLGVVALVLTGVAVSVPISRAVSRTACERYGSGVDREVRFVEYAYGDWDCLVQTTGGRWVSKDNTREVAP